jgi:hypothetical protein
MKYEEGEKTCRISNFIAKMKKSDNDSEDGIDDFMGPIPLAWKSTERSSTKFFLSLSRPSWQALSRSSRQALLRSFSFLAQIFS